MACGLLEGDDGITGTIVLLLALSAVVPAPPSSDARVPAEIGAPYGRLGKAIMAHDAAGVRRVWAEDFVVNAPGNDMLGREEVIAAMGRDLLDYRDFRKHIGFVGEKPKVTVVMGYDTMVPVKGPGAGRQVLRPFTDIWAKRRVGWQLIARQATIAAVR